MVLNNEGKIALVYDDSVKNSCHQHREVERYFNVTQRTGTAHV